jgi:hypothetical protein
MGVCMACFLRDIAGAGGDKKNRAQRQKLLHISSLKLTSIG